MNIVSCNSCGVLLDADKLHFPDQKHWWREDGSIDESQAGYDPDTGRWCPTVDCPVCGSRIMKGA